MYLLYRFCYLSLSQAKQNYGSSQEVPNRQQLSVKLNFHYHLVGI
uniref:Uncharacterized protein n=1 Tax=Anguilla anguilla TaxID=7936 RepID=A0A0E9RN75_ANGAN